MDMIILIDQIMAQIEQAGDLFYQHKDHEGYEILNETIGGLLELAEKLKVIARENEGIELGEQELLSILNEALSALEEKDTVMLSDILQYDLMERLESLKGVLE